MCEEGALDVLHRRHLAGAGGSVLDGDGGKIGAVAVVVRVVDDGGAAAALPPDVNGADRALAVHVRIDGALGQCVGAGVQLGQGGGQILGVHLLVGRVLVAHLPPVRRRRRRRDEEELVALGQRQVLVRRVQRRVRAEIDAHAVAHDGLAVQLLLDRHGRGDIEEGDYDATERAQGSPGVYVRMRVDQVAESNEVRRVEDGGILQVLKYWS